MDWEEAGVLENSISELLSLRSTLKGLEEKYGLPAKVASDANLVVEEAVVNIINYAYENNSQSHRIIVRSRMEDNELVLRIEDDGRPFNPLEVPDPDIDAPPDEREIGGLGIHLIRALSSSVSYERLDDRNVLTIRIGADRSE